MIVWMRHGESTWNATGRFQGHTAHPPLTDRGREQVEAVLPDLRRLELTEVVTSPAVRAHQSATIVAEALGLPLTVDDFLSGREAAARPLVVSHGDTIAVAWHRLTGDDLPGPLGNAGIVSIP
ncbi:MAG: hypothetical protein EON52_10050 [Actinomycetales bacterium]|nr:MAG: hypothetical protein EON52_10050 [Actinomycetales bacterium]